MEVEIPGIGDIVADVSVNPGEDIATLDGQTSQNIEAGDQMVIPLLSLFSTISMYYLIHERA
jgi:hypothetical protein